MKQKFMQKLERDAIDNTFLDYYSTSQVQHEAKSQPDYSMHEKNAIIILWLGSQDVMSKL